MKKVWFLAMGAAVLMLAGCAESGGTTSSALASEPELVAEGVTVSRSALGVPTYQLTSPSKNGYETGGDKYISWYQTTNAAVIADLNKQLDSLGYKQMSAMKDRTDLYSYDGNVWAIRFNNTRGKNETLVYEMELNLAAPDAETAKMKGGCVAALIDVFSPGERSRVTETLGIYKERSERAAKTMNFICGNTKYTLKTGEEERADRLTITPIHTPSNGSVGTLISNPE